MKPATGTSRIREKEEARSTQPGLPGRAWEEAGPGRRRMGGGGTGGKEGKGAVPRSLSWTSTLQMLAEARPIAFPEAHAIEIK